MKLSTLTVAYVFSGMIALVVAKNLVTTWTELQPSTQEMRSSLPMAFTETSEGNPQPQQAAHIVAETTVPGESHQGPPASNTSQSAVANLPQSQPSQKSTQSSPASVASVVASSSDGGVSVSPTSLPTSQPLSTANSTPSFAAPAIIAPSVTIPAVFGNIPTSVSVSGSATASGSVNNAGGSAATTPDQQATQIANDFTAAVQNSGVSPYSPGYQKVWNDAAQRADALYRQQYGNMAFEVMQKSANTQ